MTDSLSLFMRIENSNIDSITFVNPKGRGIAVEVYRGQKDQWVEYGKTWTGFYLTLQQFRLNKPRIFRRL